MTLDASPNDDLDGLARTLRAAAVEVVLEKGLGSFSLREVARRADVSHAAPGYHFGDMRGLLTSVAIEGFDVLRAVTEAAADAEEDPAERLVEVGKAYVRVSQEYPGHCQVMFRDDVVDVDDPRLQHVGLAAFGVLENTVRALCAARGSSFEINDVTRLCWSVMQGLIQLQDTFTALNALIGATDVSIEDQAERFSRMVMAGIIDAV